MPREIRWYLEELRKKHTPGQDPGSRFDVMYRTLEQLDEAIRDDDTVDEEKNRKINDLYTRAIQHVQEYARHRRNAFFGPSDWELPEGLLGELSRDLSLQARIMRDMSDPQSARRTQYQELIRNYETNVQGSLPRDEVVRQANSPEGIRREREGGRPDPWRHKIITINQMEDVLDSFGQTYDRNLDAPQALKEGMQAGSISTGRKGIRWSPASFDNWRNLHVISLIPTSFPGNKNQQETLDQGLTEALNRIHHPQFGDPDYLALIRNLDTSTLGRTQVERFVNGEPQPAGAEGSDFLRDPYLLDLVDGANPFRTGSEEDRRSFRRAFLNTIGALKQEFPYIEARQSEAGSRFFNYVESQQVQGHGYFEAEEADPDPEKAAVLAEKREKLQAALSGLARRIYNHPAALSFADGSPEAREQFASGVTLPGESHYNAIENDRDFMGLMEEADPFRADPDNINNINNDINENRFFNMPENDAAEEEREADSIVFRRAVFDMLAANARIRKDAALGFAGPDEPEEYAAAASRLAGGLGVGRNVEQVVRVRGTGMAGKNLYVKSRVNGIKASGPNLRSPESFAAEGAVLDSPELARQLADIQALRYLTGMGGRGTEDLLFAFSEEEPKRVVSVTETNLDEAFAFHPASPNLTPESLTVMSRSMADRVMSISPERYRAMLGSRLSNAALEEGVTRLSALQNAIQASNGAKWAMGDSLVSGKLHVIEDGEFQKLSVKQLAAAQNAAPQKGIFSSVYSGMVLKGEQAAAENAAYPGGLYQRQMDALMESQGDKESSNEFTNALNAIRALNTELNRYMQADRELSAEELSSLRKTYAENLTSVNTYVNATRRWHWTTRGDVRHNAMAAMQGYMQQELRALQNYSPENHWKLERIIQHGRQDEIPAIEGEPERVGGNMNQRLVVSINGRQGAFTAHHTYHMPTDEELRSEFTDVSEIPEAGRQEVGAAMGVIYRNFDRLRSNGLAFIRRDFVQTYASAAGNFMNRKDVRDLNAVLSEAGLRQISAGDDEDSRNYRRSIAQLLNRGMRRRNEMGLMDWAHIADGSNLDQRNTAMTVMSDLLEMPHATARARDARIRINGELKEGTFQEWGEGSSIGAQESTKGSDFARTGSEIMTKEAMTQLADLQVLDFVCGNIDRHFNNIMFKFEDVDGAHRLMKCTGIDNDTAFGSIRMKDRKTTEKTRQFVFPDNMLMMRQSTANAVLNLRKDTLEVALRPYIHRPEELSACWERVQGLQKQIQADRSYRFPGKYSLSEEHIRIFKDDDPIWNSMSPGDLLGSRSLFGRLADAASTAERTKRRGLDNAPDQLELRKSVEGAIGNVRKLDIHPLMEVTRVTPLEALKVTKKISEAGEDAFFAGIAEHHRKLPTATINGMGTMMQDGISLYQSAARRLKECFPGDDPDLLLDHEVVKEAGITSTLDLFYVDGRPARQFLEESYPMFRSQEYQALNSFRRDMYLQSVMGIVMTGGRHHIDMVIPGMDEKGAFTASVTEMKFDLDNLYGTEGALSRSRETRQDNLLKDGTRPDRFRSIERDVIFKMKQGLHELDRKIMAGEPGYVRIQEKYAYLFPERQNPQAQGNQDAPAANPRPIRKEKVELPELNRSQPLKKSGNAANGPEKKQEKRPEPGKHSRVEDVKGPAGGRKK